MGFLSSRSQELVDFSVQNTRLHVSWNRHRSFSACFALSAALLDKTHLAMRGVCWGPGAQAGLLQHSAFSPSPPTEPGMVWFALAPNLSPHRPLKPAPQPHSSGKSGGPTQPITGALGVTAPCSEKSGFSWEEMPARCCPHSIQRGPCRNGLAISSKKVPAQQLQRVQQVI